MEGNSPGRLELWDAISHLPVAFTGEYRMRRGRQGWVMPEEDIPSMLQMIEHKIAFSEIEVHRGEVLIRLKSLLEADLEEFTRATASKAERTGGAVFAILVDLDRTIITP
jgi:hypothetical protein